MTPARAAAATALFLIALASARAVAGGPPARQRERLDGEYGLWVDSESGGRWTVRWLTARLDSGFLRVVDRGRVLQEFRTPSAVAHAVTVDLGRGGSAQLQYGGLGNPADRHQTTLRLRGPRRGPVSFRAADSVFVVGDIHGEFDRFQRLLRKGGLVDAQGGWQGGRSHLVVLGDVLDRGGDATRVLWYLYQLEPQAAQAGGRVHLLLGNHEIMVMTNDLRYVAPKEQAIAREHGVGYARLFHPRRSLLGRWLASRPAMVRIGGALFAHGGVTPAQRRFSLQEFDDSLDAFVREELFLRWNDSAYQPTVSAAAYARRERFFWGDDSVFWFRGYLQADNLESVLAGVLRGYDSDVLVVGHTMVPSIQQRYGGALIAAHPERTASEMLLLARAEAGYRRYRIPLEGARAPL